jgi:O-antigen/teichoic acid export membrane protein
LRFGVWIFVSSIVYFFASNFDRLYLAKIIPLGLLGVYGIARNISELLGLLAARMGNGIIFPLVAALSQLPRSELRQRLSSSRLQFLFLAALGFSLFAAVADLLINVIYDERYREAGWMLPVLIAGAWFSTLCSVNESTLLGLGKPSYGALANSLKFAFLVVALPIGFLNQGARGCVIVVAAADLCRYIPIFIGQRREKFSFGMQDAVLTVVMVGLLAVWEWLRWSWGFGTSFDGLGTVTPF